jgi:sec-independent protein translocase protein TatA
VGIGGWELFLIFVIALLVFGPRKIPELARGLGKGLREIRRLSTELHREIHLAESEDEEKRFAAQRPSPPDEGSAGGGGREP